MLKVQLPSKEEHVILVRLSKIQRALYTEFMNRFRDAGNSGWLGLNPLKAFCVCCKVGFDRSCKKKNPYIYIYTCKGKARIWIETGDRSVVGGPVHPLSPEFSAVIQQNCYPHLQTWHAGMLNTVFTFWGETCSCQLNQYWADTTTGYLPQCEQHPLCLCCVRVRGAFCFLLREKNRQLCSQESLG